eukprot:1895899-Prorocentrum_lima.AAC.1
MQSAEGCADHEVGIELARLLPKPQVLLDRREHLHRTHLEGRLPGRINAHLTITWWVAVVGA